MSELAVLQHAAQNDLLFFTRWMFRVRRGYSYQVRPHHIQIVDALMRVVRGECKRLIINIPPRSGKTELSVVNFMAWALGKFPDSEFIYTSYSARLASNFSWQTRELVQNPEYQRIFPLCRLRDDSKARDEWRTTAGGIVYSVGAGGTITGYGAGKSRPGFAGCLILDDPHKADEASSDVIREGVLEWFQTTLESRKNSPETPIIVIMQRLHERDMAGWLLSGGNGEQWEHLCCAAITESGESLWPEKWSIEDLRRMEQAAPYVFAGQYLQRPAPPEGGIIKPDNLVPVDAVPAGCEFVRGWDFAASAEGDYTAGARLGRTPDGRFIIADMVRLRAGPDERDRALLNTAARDGDNVLVSIPQDPGQAGLSQAKYMVRQLAGYRVKASPESGDKRKRAEPIAAQINVGNVLMLKAAWNDVLINEMRMFPNGAHDDQIDALSRAFMELIGSAPAEIFIPDVAESQKMRAITAHTGRFVAHETEDVCGGCVHQADQYCRERSCRIQVSDPACDYFSRAVLTAD